jgi:hypothetical protein
MVQSTNPVVLGLEMEKWTCYVLWEGQEAHRHSALLVENCENPGISWCVQSME